MPRLSSEVVLWLAKWKEEGVEEVLSSWSSPSSPWTLCEEEGLEEHWQEDVDSHQEAMGPDFSGSLSP